MDMQERKMHLGIERSELQSGRCDSNLCNFHRWCHHKLDIFLPRLVDQAEGLQGLLNPSQGVLPP